MKKCCFLRVPNKNRLRVLSAIGTALGYLVQSGSPRGAECNRPKQQLGQGTHPETRKCKTPAQLPANVLRSHPETFKSYIKVTEKLQTLHKSYTKVVKQAATMIQHLAQCRMSYSPGTSFVQRGRGANAQALSFPGSWQMAHPTVARSAATLCHEPSMLNMLTHKLA
jgi:hypothetical protein